MPVAMRRRTFLTWVKTAGLIADDVTRETFPDSIRSSRVGAFGATSHSCVTQTSRSASPSLPTISVADGSSEQIRFAGFSDIVPAAMVRREPVPAGYCVLKDPRAPLQASKQIQMMTVTCCTCASTWNMVRSQIGNSCCSALPIPWLPVPWIVWHAVHRTRRST